MPTQPYFNAAGERLPSVTQIIGRCKDAGPLMYWSWDQGRKGLDFRQSQKAAADAGTVVHAQVEADIRGLAFDPTKYDPAAVEAAKNGYAAYLRWKAQTKLTAVEPEVALISEQYQFGGTLDSMLIHGELSLGDVKTSKTVYRDYLYQLAAYGILWEENFPDRPITGGYHILRFSRDYGDFAHHHYQDLTKARRAFLCLREFYGIDLEMKDRAA